MDQSSEFWDRLLGRLKNKKADRMILVSATSGRNWFWELWRRTGSYDWEYQYTIALRAAREQIERNK